jgi:flagellar basal-body rod protein FlgF
VNISLYQAASAMSANARWQEVISENMAASSVPGYKAQHMSFQAVEAGLMPAGVDSSNRTGWAMPQSSSATSFAQGDMRYTGLQTDVGIQGSGFFEVQLPNGTLAYTRDGEFQLNPNGNLVTKQGYLVMSDSGPITVDRAANDPISISADGTVSQGPQVRGSLKIVDFTKPELLTPNGAGIYLARDPGLEVATATKPTVRQYYLEQANTNAVTEMANLMTVMRASEANQRVIQMQDEQMGRAISELGNPS